MLDWTYPVSSARIHPHTWLPEQLSLCEPEEARVKAMSHTSRHLWQLFLPWGEKGSLQFKRNWLKCR